MPYKIPFAVLHVSSEEEGHRAPELTAPSPTTSGWRSAHHASFPQEIVLGLQAHAEVQRVQLLAHQFLIPSRVEFYVGGWGSEEEEEKGGELSAATWRYLGFVTLSDNQGTAFQARELKSVTLQCQGRLLKLLLHKNHKNELNKYEQVGLMALSLLGRWTEDNNNSPPVSSTGADSSPPGLPGGDEVNSINNNAANNNNNNLQALLVSNPQYTSPYDDLAFEMYVDPEAARIIRQMEVRKQQAVLAERFEYARKLKQAMEELRRAGERLGKFELEKRQAIGMEHFGKAKLKKAQMDEYRVLVYAFLEVDELLELNGYSSKNDAPIDPNRRRELPPPPRLRRSRDPSPQPPGVEPVGPPVGLGPSQIPTLTNGTNSMKRRSANGNNGNVQTRSSYEDYEERALPALKNSNQRAEELLRDCYDSCDRGSGISEREKRQAMLPIAVFGLSLVQKFYSKQFSDREDGLRLLREELTRPATEPVTTPVETPRPTSNKIARAAIFLLHRALKDKVFVVYSLAADVIRLFFTQFVPTRRVASGEIGRSIERVLPELLSKSGDSAPRIHNMAVQTILDIADCPDVRELHIIPAHLTRSLTNTTHPRLALSKMEIVEQLIMKIGISNNKQSGLTCRVLTEFGSSGLHHPSEPVRKVAERVLVLVYHVNPRLIRKALPPDDELTRRNLLYRHLFAEFDRIDVQRKREMLLEAQREEEEALTKQVYSPPHRRSAEGPSTGTGSLTRGGSMRQTSGKQVAVSTPSPAHTSSSSSSASALTSPGMDQVAGTATGTEGEEKMCIFCQRQDPSFSEQGLNVHYWRACPMLVRCQHCRQVLEVACFKRHLLLICEERQSYRECPQCREAIPVQEFHEHIKYRRCLPAEPETRANRCPFCHQNIPPWEDGWRSHLAGPRPCAAHPRRKYFPRSAPSSAESTSSDGSRRSKTPHETLGYRPKTFNPPPAHRPKSSHETVPHHKPSKIPFETSLHRAKASLDGSAHRPRTPVDSPVLMRMQQQGSGTPRLHRRPFR